jgi:splicing factor 3B subunit 1
VLIPLWKLTTQTRDKTLGSYLKAIGFIIPLMDPKHTAKYTESVMPSIIQQFRTNEEELRKIILKVLKQIMGCNGVEAGYIRKNVIREFFDSFWMRRMALEKRNYKQLIETTVELAEKVGVIEIVSEIYKGLKD